MLLGRLRIRARLAVLVNIPMIAMVVLTIATTVNLAANVARANVTADTVRNARVVSTLVRALQEERLLSVGRLVGRTERGDLLLAQAATDEAGAVVTRLGLPDVNHVVATVSLSAMRNGISVGGITPAQVISYYGGLSLAMIDSIHLLDAVDADTEQGRQVLALDAVMRANEGFALILASMAAATSPDMLPVYVGGLATLQPAGVRMTQYLSTEQLALYGTVVATFDSRLGKDFAARLLQSPGSALVNLESPPPFPDLVTLTGSGRMVESKVINDALAAAERTASSEAARAAGFLAFAVFFMVLAAVLGNVVGFSVITPLLRLTRSANRVANLAESELVRVADDDSAEAEPPRLAPIEVSGRDELADFARAFGRVQDTAAQLVERQVVSRRNVAMMFRHVGRRTQNLVGRQISLIDKLESEETEPNRLRELYRLDHMSSRLRRSASSLVVLSGATTSDEHVAPAAIDDVVRLGLAEIEDYTRVDIDVATPVRVAPALINDLVLLLAELMENATGFSPPGTRVVVSAVSTPDGARISVIDNGLGMSPDQFTEENARLTRRERLDLAPTEVLGLFVVGRLARRHGLQVVLSPTPGGGVTASVDIPDALLTDRSVAPAVPFAPRGGPAPAPTGPLAFAADPQAIDRAARTMRELRPWNAFDTAARTATEVRTAEVRTADVRSADVRTAEVRAGELRTADVRTADIRSVPPIPTQRTASSTAGAPTVGQPPSTLNRRVPGATLQSLQGTGPARPASMATPSADDARDSLAQFESGVARAMRDMDQGEGSQ